MVEPAGGCTLAEPRAYSADACARSLTVTVRIPQVNEDNPFPYAQLILSAEISAAWLVQISL